MSFNYSTTTEKNVGRSILKGLIRENLSNKVLGLTLPANNFIFEDVGSSFGWMFDCAEINPITYKNGCDKVSQRSNILSYYNDDIFNVFRRSKRKYNLIWLDLCAPFRLNLPDNLNGIISSKKLQDESIFALTLMARREKLMGSFLDNYSCLSDFRERGVPCLINSYCKNAGRKVMFSLKYYYTNEGSCTPMLLYVFKFSKNKPKQNV